MQTQLVTYEDQGTVLEGFMAFDPDISGPRPAVILCHAWRGRDDFVCEKAVEIASQGYATFALDIYGKGKLGTNKDENTALMMPFINNRLLLRSRLLAAFKTFKEQPIVDSDKIATIGFCFGGLCALDFARSGADLRGAISVHGMLNKPSNQVKCESIKAKILALHGNDDPLVPPEIVSIFEQEMTDAKADWQIHIYGGTMHAFTNPMAKDPDFGTVYNPLSAKRAWLSVRNFLAECFAGESEHV